MVQGTDVQSHNRDYLATQQLNHSTTCVPTYIPCSEAHSGHCSKYMQVKQCMVISLAAAPEEQTTVASQSTTHSVVVAMETEEQQQGYNNTTSSACPSITASHISTTLLSLLLVGLSLDKILQSV